MFLKDRVNYSVVSIESTFTITYIDNLIVLLLTYAEKLIKNVVFYIEIGENPIHTLNLLAFLANILNILDILDSADEGGYIRPSNSNVRANEYTSIHMITRNIIT